MEIIGGVLEVTSNELYTS